MHLEDLIQQSIPLTLSIDRDLLSNAGFGNNDGGASDGGIAMLAADLEAATTVMMTTADSSSLKKVSLSTSSSSRTLRAIGPLASSAVLHRSVGL